MERTMAGLDRPELGYRAELDLGLMESNWSPGGARLERALNGEIAKPRRGAKLW